MNNPIILSVIIPFYNGSRYINELIKSIQSIPINDLEILIIDDGSKKEESEQLMKVVESDKRIIYHKQENKGIVGARNNGLNHAKGEYLLFCDQDDKVNPVTIKSIISEMIAHKADIGFYSTMHFNDTGKEWKCDSVYQEGVFYENQIADIFIRKLITRYVRGEEIISYIGHLWSCVIKRQIVVGNKIQFKNFMSIEDDLLFVLDVLDSSKCVVTTIKVGYYWRSNMISATQSIPYVRNITEKMEKYYEYRTNVLNKHNICDDIEMQNYLKGMRQEYILNLVRNESLHGIMNYSKTKALILNALADRLKYEAIKDTPRCPFAFNRKHEMEFLKKDKINLLILYSIFVTEKRRIKHMLYKNVLIKFF